MLKKTASCVAPMLFICAHSSADVIAVCSFEEASSGSKYFDTLDTTSSHQMLNNDGEMQVNFDGSANEIGFTSWFMPTDYTQSHASGGMADGSVFGVKDWTDNANGVQYYTDGVQGFQMSDTDGIGQLRMAEVSGATSVSFDIWVRSTGWETYVNASTPLDTFSVGFGAAGVDTANLLDNAGEDLDDWFESNNIVEGDWNSFTFDLSTLGLSTGSLQFSLEVNSSNETLIIDNIVFEGQSSGPVVPGAGGLAVLIGVAGIRRRRR